MTTPIGRQLTLSGPGLPRLGTLQRKVLEMLLERRWVCGQDLASEVGWAFGSRLSDLRARGFDIQKRQCLHPRHRHAAAIWQYTVVVGEPGEP